MLPNIYLSTASKLFDDLVSFEFNNGIGKCYRTKADFPPMNIWQDENFIEIKMAIAGFAKEDIEIETKDQYLTISGKAEETSKYDEETGFYINHNLRKQSFSRTFKWSDNSFDFRNPEVSLKDGLLILLVKKDPSLISEKKKIEIK